MSPTLLRSLLHAAPTRTLAPVAARTGDLTGTGIDVSDLDGTVRVVLHGVRAAGNMTPALEHSDVVGSGYAAVPAGALAIPSGAQGFGLITAGSDFTQELDVDVSQLKGFLRLVVTTASSPNHTYGCKVIGIKKQAT